MFQNTIVKINETFKNAIGLNIHFFNPKWIKELDQIYATFQKQILNVRYK